MRISCTENLRKAFRLSSADGLLLLEAGILLVLAGVAIRLLPFRLLGRLAEFPLRRPVPRSEVRHIESKRVRWAIEVCARRMQWDGDVDVVGGEIASAYPVLARFPPATNNEPIGDSAATP